MNSTALTSSNSLRARKRPSPPASQQHPNTTDDDALLEGLKRGDIAAQSEVFRRYQAAVTGVLSNILTSSPDIQDAVQDTFVKVFRSAIQVREPRALRSWILRVAASVGLDEFRRRQRLRERGLGEHDKLDLGWSVTPVEARRALWDTYRVLSVMPPQEQRVFTLRYIDGLELTKIADVCEVSLATVKRRLERAATRFNSLARHRPALTDWR